MRVPSRAAAFHAALAGQAAGLVMLATFSAASVVTGHSPLWPLQVMTSLFAGAPPLERVTLRSLLPGLLAHQTGPALAWAKLYGLLVGFARHRIAFSTAVGLGLLLGVVAMLTDVWLLMPLVQRQLHGRNLWAENIPRWEAWLTHLAYGISLGIFYARWQPTPDR